MRSPRSTQPNELPRIPLQYLRGKKFRREKNYSEIFRPKNFVNCSQNFSSAKNFVLFLSNFDI